MPRESRTAISVGIGATLLNYIVLGASAVFTLVSFGVAFSGFRERRRGRTYWATFRQSKDPTLFTLVLEDIADLAGHDRRARIRR